MKIVVCGNYGATNLGDEAILDGILVLINSAFNMPEITVLSANPNETSKLHAELAPLAVEISTSCVAVKSAYLFPAGVRSFIKNLFKGARSARGRNMHFVRGGEIFRTLKVIKNCDLFILGGGGLFTDEKLKACFIWWLQAKIAFIFRKPLFCLGQSVGPLRTRLGKRLTTSVFKKAKAVTVRDSASYKLLKEMAISKVELKADPAFLLTDQITPTLLHESPLVREKYIVFSVRSWINGNQASLYNICSQFIDWLYSNYGFKSILIPFQAGFDSDTTPLNNIFIQLKNKEAAKVIPHNNNYKETLRLISNAEATVGMRLHSIIFSVLCRKPFLALSYSKKVKDLCLDLNMEKYVLDWENLNLDSLKDSFKNLLDNRATIEKDLKDAESLMKEKALDQIKILQSFNR